MTNEQDTFAGLFGELVGRGAQAVVYARGDVAVKVFNANYPREFAFYEAAVMGLVKAGNVPMPKPYEVLEVKGRICLKMSRVTGRLVTEMILAEPDRALDFLDDLVKLQLQIHTGQVLMPVRLKPKLKELIEQNGNLDLARKQAILALCEELPEGNALCHGDFHSGNVLFKDGVYSVVDWIEVAKGNPLVDACHSYAAYALGSVEFAEAYLARYCAASGANRHEVLRWVPIQAAALYGRIPETFNETLLRMMDEPM